MVFDLMEDLRQKICVRPAKPSGAKTHVPPRRFRYREAWHNIGIPCESAFRPRRTKPSAARRIVCRIPIGELQTVKLWWSAPYFRLTCDIQLPA